MAATVRKVHSQEIINAGQGYQTPATSHTSSPEAQKSPHAEKPRKVLVQDSLKDTETVPVSRGNASQPQAAALEDEEEDLYGVSPERDPRNRAFRLSQQSQSERIPASIEQIAQSPSGRRTNSQLTAIAKASSAAYSSIDQQEHPTESPPAKLKVLTHHTSDADPLKPAFQDTDAVEKSASTKSHGASQSATPSDPSATAPTSTMAPTRRGEPALATETDTRSTGKRSALEALNAKKGLPMSQPRAHAPASQPAQEKAASKSKSQGAKNHSKAASATQRAATGHGANEKTLATEPKGKAAASKSSKGPSATARSSNAQKPSRQAPTQAETSKIEDADSPAADRLEDAEQGPVVEDDSNAEETVQPRSKLKKTSRSTKGKGRKVDSDTAVTENDRSHAATMNEHQGQSKSSASPRRAPQAPNASQEHEEAEEEEDPVMPSQPRKRGKGALPSRAKKPPKQPEPSQPSEDGYSLEESSSPKVKKGKNNGRSQAKKKPAPKSKPAHAKPPATTTRTTRAQAAAEKLHSDVSSSDRSHEAKAESSKAPRAQMRTSKAEKAAANESRKRRADPSLPNQDEEGDDGAASMDESKVQLQSKTNKRKSRVKSQPSRPARHQNPQKQAARDSLPKSAPGGTQEEPILVSDDKPSSSVHGTPTSSPESKRQTKVPAKDASHSTSVQNRPRTPANLRSSPPAHPQYDLQDDDEAVAATMRSRKAGIIGFDANGPRNQGTLSGRTPGAKPGRANRPSLPATKVPIASSGGKSRPEASRKNRESSVATSTRTAKSNRPAPPPNIAVDFDEALTGLSRKSAKNVNEESVLIQDQVAHDQTTPQVADDDGFVNIGDVEGEKLIEPTVPEKRASIPLNLNRTASQLAMPPPAKRPAATESLAVLQNQDNVAESAPPKKRNGKRPRSPEPPVERPAKRSKAEHVASEEPTDGEAEIMTGKEKKAPGETVEAHAGKRTRATRATEAATEAPQKRVKLGPEAAEEHHSQHEEPREAPKVNDSQRDAISKRRKRGSRRTIPCRQTSQGSQTVDRDGSPVPPDMDLTADGTVLEQFSQEHYSQEQADLSPHVSSELATVLCQPLDAIPKNGHQRSSGSDPFRPPPSAQNNILSSNVKPRPAAPQAQSKISRVHSRDLELMKQHDPLAPEENPFSDVPGKPLGRMTTLTKKLNVVDKKGDHRDPIKKQTARMPVKSLSPQRQAPPEIPSLRSREVEQGFGIFRGSCAEVEDPDKTLVNDDEQEDFIPEQIDDDEGGDLHEEEHDFAAGMELSDIDSDDALSWYKTLKPHQQNMFEGLVDCSRRISAYFVKQENSIERHLERQHKAGMHIIEEDEFLRAKQYEQEKETLVRTKVERKKELKHDLKECDKDLKDRNAARSRRMIRAGQRDDETNRLEALLHGMAY